MGKLLDKLFFAVFAIGLGYSLLTVETDSEVLTHIQILYCFVFSSFVFAVYCTAELWKDFKKELSWRDNEIEALKKKLERVTDRSYESQGEIKRINGWLKGGHYNGVPTDWEDFDANWDEPDPL